MEPSPGAEPGIVDRPAPAGASSPPPPFYSRQAPSPRYLELLTQYRQMHVEGDRSLGTAAEDTYAGKSAVRHAVDIQRLIAETGARSLLDYGSGKGGQYERRDFKVPKGPLIRSLADYWAVGEIAKYDPAYAPFAELPRDRFDGVICTDVLEHCPEEDVPWIVDEMFGFARRFVFATVACFPALKTLPSGENAHCTIQPAAWWAGLLQGIAQHHPGIRYRVLIDIKVGYWTWSGRRRRVQTETVLDNAAPG